MLVSVRMGGAVTRCTDRWCSSQDEPVSTILRMRGRSAAMNHVSSLFVILFALVTCITYNVSLLLRNGTPGARTTWESTDGL